MKMDEYAALTAGRDSSPLSSLSAWRIILTKKNIIILTRQPTNWPSVTDHCGLGALGSAGRERGG